MIHQELVLQVIDIIQSPSEDTMESFLQTMATLPEPEDQLEASLRNMIVDMAVQEYLGICNCEGKE